MRDRNMASVLVELAAAYRFVSRIDYLKCVGIYLLVRIIVQKMLRRLHILNPTIVIRASFHIVLKMSS